MAVVLACGGCLDLNPDFIEGGSEGATDSATEAAGDDDDDDDDDDASDGGSDDGPSDALCDVDPYEPNSLSVPALISFGQLDAALEDEADLDLYSTDLVSDSAVEVVALIDRADLKVCVFASCPGGGTATIVKCTGEEDTGGNGEPGCCNPGGVSIEPMCDTDFNATVWASIDASPGGCAPYRLDFNAVTL